MATMEQMSKTFQSLWKSERLVYVAMEDNDRCKDFCWNHLAQDPVSRGFIEAGRPSPPSRASSDNTVADSGKYPPLLAVMVCLPATELSAEPEIVGWLKLDRHFQDGGKFSLAFSAEHQNKGYGREALNWAIDYGFRWAHLHRLAIGCFSYNERAAHLYESLGFKLEGRMRECFFADGHWFDLIEFSMLESDWKKLRGISD